MGKDVAHAPRLLICGCIAAVCIAAFPLLVAAQGSPKPDEARKRLEADRIQKEAEKVAKERSEKALQSEVDKIAAERERINARLVETAKLVQQSEGQLNLIESRLGELDVQEKHLRDKLEARHGSISALLAAMLRMGRNPPPVMVASRKDVLSAFRSGTLLTPVLHGLGDEAKQLSEQLTDLMRAPDDHPVIRPTRTGDSVRNAIIGVHRPTDDGDGAYVWLEVGSEPLTHEGSSRRTPSCRRCATSPIW